MDFYDFWMMVMKTIEIIIKGMVLIIWEGVEEREHHTSAGSDCGICCSEKACLGNQRRRTCSKRFEDPPLVLVSQGWMKKRRGKIGEFGGWERERERPRKPKSKQEPKKEREYNHSEKREETQEKRGERNRDRESLHFI